MQTKEGKATKKPGMEIKTGDDSGCHMTTVKIHGSVEIGVTDSWLYFWVAGQEVRIGPLTADQAEKLSEDLAYDSLEGTNS
ncbi:MAG: hypothetical protein K2R98_33565 [Gemmataceae bacterium]|nr:hypothetical protein [Gemmataceae bacterium]